MKRTLKKTVVEIVEEVAEEREEYMKEEREQKDIEEDANLKLIKQCTLNTLYFPFLARGLRKSFSLIIKE